MSEGVMQGSSSDLRRGYTIEDSDEVSGARIGSQLAFAEENVHLANDRLAKLKAQLEDVLLPSYPEPGLAETKMPPQEASPLSHRMNTLNLLINDLICEINHISSRIQL